MYDQNYTTYITLAEMQKGSLVFKVYPNHDIFHVGIYLGNQSVIESTQKIGGFKGVQLTLWNEWQVGNYTILAGNLVSPYY